MSSLCSMPLAHSSASALRAKDFVSGGPPILRTRTRQVVLPDLPFRDSIVAIHCPKLSQRGHFGPEKTGNASAKLLIVAEAVRFELTDELPRRRFSRPVP